jgi:DNA helicase-2/ATP-dependent DNA helicase PcrA
MANDLPWLAELNPEQRRAVCHGDGPLLVVAGAGSGKTRTLAYRTAYLIATGVPPQEILLLTFTRRAAQEMIRRARSIVSSEGAAKGAIWGGTFHSVANRLLRLYGKPAGVSPQFTVLDQSDAQDLMDVLRHELGLHQKDKRFPRKQTCLAIYSRRVNGSEELPEVVDRYFPWCSDWKDELKLLFRTYVERKQSHQVLDYDDLLLYLAHLLSDPDVGARIGRRFRHVLVDEYQDTNKLQAGILKGLRRDNPNIMVVGDDAQSIYSFRAAAVDNMFSFPEDFPGTTIVTLETNYRSVSPILETTNRLIRQARRRYTKDLQSARGDGRRPLFVTCRDETDQDAFVVSRILEHYEEGIPLRRQAVLFRSAFLSNSLEVELTRRNIPYHKYGGLRFLEAAHIKDLLGFLRVAENPRDAIAWFRILQLLEGVGPATASKIVAHVVAHGFDPTSVADFSAPPSGRKALRSYARLFERMNLPDATAPAQQVELVRRVYDRMIDKLHENADSRRRDLENLQQIASRYRSRRSFLLDLHLDPPNSTSDLAGPPSRDEDWLVLSTIHSAKGGEWDAVYLIHAADGCLPSDMGTGSEEEIEEELRLTYVAMTRARDFLYVSWPLRYYHAWHSFTDRHSYAQRCRFLNSDVLASMQALATTEGPQDDEPETELTQGDLASAIRAMWD